MPPSSPHITPRFQSPFALRVCGFRRKGKARSLGGEGELHRGDRVSQEAEATHPESGRAGGKGGRASPGPARPRRMKSSWAAHASCGTEFHQELGRLWVEEQGRLTDRGPVRLRPPPPSRGAQWRRPLHGRGWPWGALRPQASPHPPCPPAVAPVTCPDLPRGRAVHGSK